MQSHILIVGLGAIGSHVALALRNIDAELSVCDFDTVEYKNTQAQFYTVQDVRRNKAVATKRNLYGYWQKVAGALSYKITGDNAADVLSNDYDLVLDCTDNIVARLCLMAGCNHAKTPLLHAGLSADGKFAQVMWTERFKPDAEDGDGVTCEDGENLPFHLLVGSSMAIIVQQWLKNGAKNNVHITSNKIIRV